MKSELMIRQMRDYLMLMAAEADHLETEQSLLDCAETLSWVLSDADRSDVPNGLEGELSELLEDYARQIATDNN